MLVEICFFIFLFKKAEKGKKARFSKLIGFLSMHQNVGRRFYSQKNTFSVIHTIEGGKKDVTSLEEKAY